MEEITVCICGAGAAGCAIGRMLLDLGAGDVIFCDKDGLLQDGDQRMEPARRKRLRGTNRYGKTGTLADGVKGADVFVGVSAPGVLTGEMVQSMAKNAIVFAMANPTPEIFPAEALEAGALVVGTGRSDFPNQVNNVLAFPGIFRGALDARAKRITKEMKMAAAYALAGLVGEDDLSPNRILPDAFDARVASTVAAAVARAWKDEV